MGKVIRKKPQNPTLEAVVKKAVNTQMCDTVENAIDDIVIDLLGNGGDPDLERILRAEVTKQVKARVQ